MAFYGFPRWDYWDPSPIPLDLILCPKDSTNVALKLRYFFPLDLIGVWGPGFAFNSSHYPRNFVCDSKLLRNDSFAPRGGIIRYFNQDPALTATPTTLWCHVFLHRKDFSSFSNFQKEKIILKRRFFIWDNRKKYTLIEETLDESRFEL